jgi:hypothetical protein
MPGGRAAGGIGRRKADNMIRRVLTGLLGAAALAALSGCMTNEIKPLAKVNPIQAQTQIPEEELLDVAVRVFDPGIPAEIANDEEELAKRRVFPEIRQAESRYIATMLRSTLESSGQWGAVRVVPDSVEFVDVIVDGKIVESTGARLELLVTVKDSTGRVWFADRKYESPADIGSYKTDAALRARDPFQNVYSQIANDMVVAREQLASADRREIRRVTELRFASDLAPAAMEGYLTTGDRGILKVARLPAENDPIATRIQRLRERDAGVIDTVDGYYANFAEQMRDSYGNWRRSSFEEIEKEQRLRQQARTRTILGAAAVVASVFVPGQCNYYDYNCRRIENAARTAGAIGGTAAVLSGLKKFADAKVHAQTVKELSESFEAEVAPQVVDVEGRTLRLTGTAEEQYREWRRLLHQLHLEETGGVAVVPAPLDGATAPAEADAAVGTGNDAATAPATASGSAASEPSS